MLENKLTRQLSWRFNASLGIASLAAVLSAASLVIAMGAEDRAYARMLTEVDACVKPIYRDFNLKYPSSQPPTLKELIAPLFESVSEASRAQSREPRTSAPDAGARRGVHRD